MGVAYRLIIISL